MSRTDFGFLCIAMALMLFISILVASCAEPMPVPTARPTPPSSLSRHWVALPTEKVDGVGEITPFVDKNGACFIIVKGWSSITVSPAPAELCKR
jgi:hypothetical protein